jgi:hypothetical protein
MTQIYFAFLSGVGRLTFEYWDWEREPLNILVSFPFVGLWRRKGFNTPGVRTILDSGAYSAWKSGVRIDIDALCEEARNPEWHEVVSLDVIGDCKASCENALYMKAQGLQVMPVFHYGDDWAYLDLYCREFDRVGLSCRFGEPLSRSYAWLDQCFTRGYPKKFHSFGWVERKMLWRFPFYSADTTSWGRRLKYGRSHVFGHQYRVPRSSEGNDIAYDLRPEIRYYLQLQRDLQSRWKEELAWATPSHPQT